MADMANPIGKAILTVLDVFGSAVGFTGFLPNEFPNKGMHIVDRQQQAQDSMVRVVVALNSVEDSEKPMDPYQPSSPLTNSKIPLVPQIGAENSVTSNLGVTRISGSRRIKAPVDKLHIYNF
ncbi:MAG: hypothetical protein ASARMPRED_002422 [Alectoria sarmentosa]|nr:MAG: hypothetical protein ASARMPRED_002422 [Alectoria sarmentosa]